MAVQWTKEQKQVISLRGRNMLVSAAAGSGKTAVLVERILAKITDKEHPVDIDRLLVVTFTRAAAEEMKERLGRAIEEKLGEDPENENLQRQTVLLHNAQINTIHGFCTYIIKNYYHRINLDPNYRLAEEDELRLLKKDVLQELMEEEHEKKEPAFLELLDAFSPGRSDGRIAEIVQRIYDFAVSAPDPMAWLRAGLEETKAETFADVEEKEWFSMIMEESKRLVAQCMEENGRDSVLCEELPGPVTYYTLLTEERHFLEDLAEADSYGRMYEALRKISWTALPRTKNKDVDPALREQVKERRNGRKTILKKLQTDYFSLREEELLAEMSNCSMHMEEFVRLTGLYFERYAECKRSRNILDFADLEHFALAILLDEKGEANETAKEIGSRFEEVMTDEYQDSNRIQEVLLDAVSGRPRGINNRFMVGDMKQAIYGFRMARPDIFLEKYKNYTEEESPCQRIDLQNNFRSRKEVLEAANAAFKRLMRTELGGLAYDAAAMLYPGAPYAEAPDPDFPKAELILVAPDDTEGEEKISGDILQETEAVRIAEKILELKKTQKVYDTKKETFRSLEFSDCVILMRSTAGDRSDTILRVLQEKGVPAFAVSKTGYFSAVEVVTVLQYLRICDNPMQEIPLAAVLHSPIVGLGAADLAEIRSSYPGVSLFQAVEQYANEEDEDALSRRCKSFLEQLNNFRYRSTMLTVYELLKEILNGTGYGMYAAAMPGGEQRSANLEMLLQKALQFENTGYQGLFQFIRYVEQLHKYEVDYGEANLNDENANVVRLMTIHKSKGLEFPVVFIAGMDKRFNESDSKEAVVLQTSMGMGLDCVDTERRMKWPSVQKQAIRLRLKKEMLAEELRVLYVAMTRAKEKLIMTGVVKNIESKLLENRQIAGRVGSVLSYSALTSAGSYLDWILRAFCDCPSMIQVYDEMLGGEEIEGGNYSIIPSDDVLSVRLVTARDAVVGELERQAEKKLLLDQVKQLYDRKSETEMYALLKEQDEFIYPYDTGVRLPTVISVTELKRLSQLDEAGDAMIMAEEKRRESPKQTFEEEAIPRIRSRIEEKQEKENYGARRGTVYHRVLECLNYDNWKKKEDFEVQLEEMIRDGKLKESDRQYLSAGDFEGFRLSELGRRMRTAAEKDSLFREQPFLMQIPASTAREIWPETEELLVQGIIDAWFEEEGQAVIVDYKTDRTDDPTGRGLIEKYSKQLFLYKKALEKAAAIEVKEMWIYSISLNKGIRVGTDMQT